MTSIRRLYDAVAAFCVCLKVKVKIPKQSRNYTNIQPLGKLRFDAKQRTSTNLSKFLETLLRAVKFLYLAQKESDQTSITKRSLDL